METKDEVSFIQEKIVTVIYNKVIELTYKCVHLLSFDERNGWSGLERNDATFISRLIKLHFVMIERLIFTQIKLITLTVWNLSNQHWDGVFMNSDLIKDSENCSGWTGCSGPELQDEAFTLTLEKKKQFPNVLKLKTNGLFLSSCKYILAS